MSIRRHLSVLPLCAVLVLILLPALPARAADPAPVALAPLDHLDATLAVTGADGGTTLYTPGRLETLPTVRVVTTTPWRDTPTTFDGVLLRDLLAAHGLSDIPSISVWAENDFRVTVDRAIWQDTPLIVATRANGAPIARRARGPFLFVLDADSYQDGDLVGERHLVWMAARIAPER